MAQLTDGRGAEISWDADRFEMRQRFDRVIFGMGVAMTIASSITVMAGIVYGDRGTIVVGALTCLGTHVVAYGWALTSVTLDPARAVRSVVARGATPRELAIDGHAIAAEAAIAIAIDPPGSGRTRVHLVTGSRARVLASARREEAARIADALARVLRVTPRATTPSELAGARTPTRPVTILALAAVVGLVSIGAMQAAVMWLGAHDPALGRALTLVAGPLVLLGPIPYWALVRRLART